MTDYTPSGGRSVLRIVAEVAMALVLLGVGAVGGHWWWPQTETGMTGTVHGPFQVVDALPSGYAQDAAGAAAAAAGWQYAMNAASNGRVDAGRLLPELASQTHSASVAEVVSSIRAVETGAGAVTVPLRIVVTEFATTRAVVRVVSCTSPASDESDWGSGCGTTDLALAWESEDWKVSDRAWSSGVKLGGVSVAGSLPAPLMVFVE